MGHGIMRHPVHYELTTFDFITLVPTMGTPVATVLGFNAFSTNAFELQSTVARRRPVASRLIVSV